MSRKVPVHVKRGCSVFSMALLASCLSILGGLSLAQVKIDLSQFSVASMIMTTALKCMIESHKLLFCVSMEYRSHLL